jgi:hypothetical protein
MKGLRILSAIGIVTLVTFGVLGFGQVETPALPPPVTLRAGASETTPQLNDLVIVPPPVYDPNSSLSPGSASPISADSPDFVTTTTLSSVGADSESADSPSEGTPSAPPADVDDSPDGVDSSASVDSIDSPDD